MSQYMNHMFLNSVDKLAKIIFVVSSYPCLYIEWYFLCRILNIHLCTVVVTN